MPARPAGGHLIHTVSGKVPSIPRGEPAVSPHLHGSAAGRGASLRGVATDVIAELTAALPEGAVLTDPDVMQPYRRDAADLCEAGTPVAVVRARSTQDVVAVLRIASATRTAVVPQGARTGLAGGANAVDGCIVLSTATMDRILEIDPVNRLAVVQPGVVNADISRAAAGHGLRYPPDPELVGAVHHRRQCGHQRRRHVLREVWRDG